MPADSTLDPLTSFLIKLIADPDTHKAFLDDRADAVAQADPPMSDAQRDALLSGDPQQILDNLNCQGGIRALQLWKEFVDSSKKAKPRRKAAKRGAAKKSVKSVKSVNGGKSGKGGKGGKGGKKR